MAKKLKRCWAIDIGQCAVKALRCTLDGDQVIADAFDYIEYPKILSQPEAEPEQLIREALETFLSRNEISRRDDKVAISVPGQSGLAKFFKPPPVDVKRLPAIVKFEAKQQIPFPLEEVIWDYQKLVGGAEVDGFVIDAEVGLFAMKREQVFRALKPFDKADIQLDIVQLAPISIYNFVTHDILTDGPDPDLFDADNPPESIVVLSLGTDATDLVVTNGFRMWQRSIPLGGNHFTKQLTKELKLTFAKAEHLKRNARQAEDPKTVFQAMRPIFNDLVTEVQRSVGYFQGLDRKAKIRGVVLLGNTVKLPGLQQYIAKNLGYEVIPFEKFSLLTGDTVLTAPQFSENAMSFGVCYGLCLQGLGKARLETNLLPKEIMSKRLIKSKKPWAVASLGALMLACSFNFFFHYNVWSKVKEDATVNGKAWSQGETQAAQVQSTSNQYKATQADKEAQLAFIKKIG
ncbi:MAG TPA: type IV pilus assembly protein PilM, partial [Nitrospiraceae bacterium]|nr:type IV pilus assembly protein PilM [Nitrospiraceae bacterium]